MTIKEKDRRKAFWISFIYIMASPIMVYYGMEADVVKNTTLALTGLGIAHYFSAPKENT